MRRLLPVLAGMVLLAALAAVLLLRPPPTPDTPGDDGMRLVSLSPAVTETVYALGAGEQLVARSAACDHPAPALRLPSVGVAAAPDLDAISAARPSTILAVDDPEVPVEALERIAPVTALSWDGLDGIVRSVRTLGALLDRRAQAETLAEELLATAVHTAGPDAPTALLLLGVDDLSSGEVWYEPSTSLRGRAMGAAGLRHAAPGPAPDRPVLRVLDLVERDPDVLVVLLNDAELTPARREAIRATLGTYTSLSAVEHDRIAIVHGDQILSDGPAYLGFVADLKEAVHPWVSHQD